MLEQLRTIVRDDVQGQLADNAKAAEMNPRSLKQLAALPAMRASNDK